MRTEAWSPLLKSYPDSVKVNSVSIGAECLYVRLIAQSDDNAHYYGDAAWIAARLFTSRSIRGEVTTEAIANWIAELEYAGLVIRYEAGGSTYLELVDCKKCRRSDVKADARFPARVRPECVTEAGRTRNESGPSELEQELELDLELEQRRGKSTSTAPALDEKKPVDDITVKRQSPQVARLQTESTVDPSQNENAPERTHGPAIGIQQEQDIDSEVRRYCSGHPSLMWDPKTHRNIRKLVESAGWDEARRLIDDAIASGAALPAGYALQVWASRQAKRDAKKVDHAHLEEVVRKALERGNQ